MWQMRYYAIQSLLLQINIQWDIYAQHRVNKINRLIFKIHYLPKINVTNVWNVTRISAQRGDLKLSLIAYPSSNSFNPNC